MHLLSLTIVHAFTYLILLLSMINNVMSHSVFISTEVVKLLIIEFQHIIYLQTFNFLARLIKYMSRAMC